VHSPPPSLTATAAGVVCVPRARQEADWAQRLLNWDRRGWHAATIDILGGWRERHDVSKRRWGLLAVAVLDFPAWAQRDPNAALN